MTSGGQIPARDGWTTAWNYSVPTKSKVREIFGAGWQLHSVLGVPSGRPVDIGTGSTSCGDNQRPDVVPGQPFVLPVGGVFLRFAFCKRGVENR